MPPPPGSFNPIEGPGDYTFTKEVHNDTYPAIDPTKADLSGRSVFIIGASRGIGHATALAFAKAGASSIAIGARSDLSGMIADVKQAAEKAGRSAPKVLPVKIDVTSTQSVEDASKLIANEFGSLDIAIHNAGILVGLAKIADSDPDVWWRNWEVNVRGPYLTSRFFIPLLLKSELKTWVTVSSVGAAITLPTGSAYQAGKTAVSRLVDFMSAEYKDEGLVAFSVHPGNIATDIVDTSAMDPQFAAVFTETPELPADSLVYLTNVKRDWLGGRYINLTWDLPELTSSPKKDEIVEKDLLKIKLRL